MKTILIFLLAFAFMGCSVNANVTSEPTTLTISEYRTGMENGAIASTAVVGASLCRGLDVSKEECTNIKNLMIDVSVLSIKQMSDSLITDLRTKDTTYKGAMKAGANVFSEAVGSSLCSTLKYTPNGCITMQGNMRQISIQFIDSLPPEVINKLQEKTSHSNDLVA